jgi:PAS domain S-box-containing protein
MRRLLTWPLGLTRLWDFLSRPPEPLGWGDSIDQMPLALVRLDAEGCMTGINDGWEELTGYRPWECLQRSHKQFLHIEDQQTWLHGLHELRGSQPPRQLVQILRYLTRRGDLRWVEVRVRRQGSGFIASLGDVSAQMPHRQSLAASHRSLSNLLDGLPMMVYRCRNNRHWTMEYVSAGSLDVTGYAPEQLVDSSSLTFNSLIHPDDRERVWNQVQAGLDSHGAFHLEYRLLCADGCEKSVQERGCGIYSDSGELLGLEGVVMEAALGPLAG